MKKLRFGFVLIFMIFIISSIDGLIIDSVSVSPDLIAPGENARIKMALENNGNRDVEDLSVYLDLGNVPFAPYDSATEFNFDEIKENRVKFAEFSIVALSDAESGIYKIPIRITYKEEDTDNEEIVKNSLISLSVNSDPVISAGLEEGLLLKNQENELSIKIINKGLSNIKFLEVQIQGSTSYNILSPNEEYIGDLDSDDFESVEFNVFFKETSQNIVNIPLILKYKDALNKDYEESFILSPKVYSTQKAVELGLIKKNNTTTYIFLGIIVIILYLIYRAWKRRRRLKKANFKEEIN